MLEVEDWTHRHFSYVVFLCLCSETDTGTHSFGAGRGRDIQNPRVREGRERGPNLDCDRLTCRTGQPPEVRGRSSCRYLEPPALQGTSGAADLLELTDFEGRGRGRADVRFGWDSGKGDRRMRMTSGASQVRRQL
ncbi:hypothetical protein MPTK1_5g13400 [Marchantia polymorpha subsp. ruderalis]|uniref:Uncharacterized protein n=2 Tax=Marchantia polymorpha TaxID=3197 RepID=A0AAF6BHY0_MARPO|nr:hypothetical protein MARPO_0032s0033 [Marchantia polymorpha]BBN11614.1 hypothetical protein Mp_5g13400 [Marchantia polymorpha subsp. ruderalis]|eukprot:PTQ41828.1 hypothetical protein MARPO_0032s0033 [Marchantia polymorpha]